MNKITKAVSRLEPVTVVLVTDQFRCERLITEGRKIADRCGTTLNVINVAVSSAERNPQAIEYLYQVSKDNDATMMIHYSHDPVKYISQMFRDSTPANVVTGMPQANNSMLHRLWMRFEQVSFFVVEENGEAAPVTLKDKVTA
ncbi:MAG: hypothetical protein VB100_02410 [Angelakisella sp.]|nr:hypothetical protein [Angelakisella sp.]